MTLADFHNGLRILTSIDRDEIEAAGALLTDPEWIAFRNPYRFFIHTDDKTRAIIWKVMTERL